MSFTPEQIASGKGSYNYAQSSGKMDELPGISVFFRNPQDKVFHTYSCYARGLDMLNSAYHLLDLVPKGRDEAGLAYGMAWLNRHDEYGTKRPRRSVGSNLNTTSY